MIDPATREKPAEQVRLETIQELADKRLQRSTVRLQRAVDEHQEALEAQSSAVANLSAWTAAHPADQHEMRL